MATKCILDHKLSVDNVFLVVGSLCCNYPAVKCGSSIEEKTEDSVY